MDKKQLLTTEAKEATISKTGYRALFLLRLLMEGSKTRDEIAEAFSKDPLIAKDLSKDTVTNTVNALRLAGCVITRPNMRTEFKYILTEHPFSIRISKSQVAYLQELRKGVISFCDWQLIDGVNKFYNKICCFVQDDKAREQLKSNHPLKKIDQKVLTDLVRYAKSKKTVNLVYNSAKNGMETLSFIPDFIQFESDKLYVWGYSFKYDNIGYLRIDKIKSVDIIDFSDNSEILDKYFSKITKVTYKLIGESALMFMENRQEKILRKITNGLLIEANVYSEFNFIQKLLSYGADCTIIGPTDFKVKFINIIKELRAGYPDEE